MAPRKTKAEKPEKDSPEVAQAKANLGIQPGVEPTEEQKKALEELNGIQPPPPAPNIRRNNYQRKLYTKLEGEAFHDTTIEYLGAQREYDQLESSKDAVVAEWKGILKRQDERVQELRNKLDSGKTELVDVEEVMDLDNNRVKVFRLDTQEVLEDRELTAEEQQLDIADLDAAPAVEEAGESEDAGDPEDLDADLPPPEGEEEDEEADPDKRALPDKDLPVGDE